MKSRWEAGFDANENRYFGWWRFFMTKSWKVRGTSH